MEGVLPRNAYIVCSAYALHIGSLTFYYSLLIPFYLVVPAYYAERAAFKAYRAECAAFKASRDKCAASKAS